MENFVHHYGYLALFALAMAESMCIPVPSEITFGFAGALCTAEVAHGKPLNLVLVILIGLFGELTGSLVAYTLGRTAGRAAVDRYGKWILLSHKDLDASEAWFKKYGNASIVIGRMIPIVRSAISVPAGIAEMAVPRFIILTAIGSVVWIGVLASLGYAAGSNWQHVAKYFHAAQWPIIVILVLGLGYGFYHRWKAVRGTHGAS